MIKRIWALLDRRCKRRFLVVYAIAVVGGVVELAGLTAVVPLLSVLTSDGGSMASVPWGESLALQGVTGYEQKVELTALLLMLIFGVRFLFLCGMYYLQADFIREVFESISRRLFAGYVRSSYRFHVAHNSGMLLRNITTETQQLITYVLIPVTTILVESIVILLIFSFLVFLQPYLTLIFALIIAIAMSLFQNASRRVLIAWGESRQAAEGERVTYAQSALLGIKEVKTFNKEDFFIDKYSVALSKSYRVQRNQMALTNIPRLYLEVTAVFLVGLFLYTSASEYSGSQTAVLIGTFAVAAFRLLPSANRLLTSFQFLKYSKPVLVLIENDITAAVDSSFRSDDHQIDSDGKSEGHKSLTVSNVSFRYPEADSDTLISVNFSVRVGEIIGIVGESGAGKSTLIDICLGLNAPTSGEIFIDDHRCATHTPGRNGALGYVPQEINLLDDTVRRNIAYGCYDDNICEEKLAQAIQIADLGAVISALPEGLETIIGERGATLSGGQRQRLGIARAMYLGPSILVLDEATSALDVATEARVIGNLNSLRAKIAIILIAHRPETLRACDQVYELRSGHLSRKHP